MNESTIYLQEQQRRIIDVALEVGFNNPISFSRSFKEVYGISPSHYQKQLLPLQNFDKPDLSLSHIVVEEGEPLISEGVVLAIQQKTMDQPRVFNGIVGYYPFKYGKMLGERTGVDPVEKIWQDFFTLAPIIHFASRDAHWCFLSRRGTSRSFQLFCRGRICHRKI